MMQRDAILDDDPGRLSDVQWLARLEELGEEVGFYEPLGRRHSAFYADDGPVLLVTFETVAGIRAGQPDQMPLGRGITRGNGWSHLCLIARGETWFRDPAVYAFFDRLVDETFFENFDRVVFFGAGMAGYAAAAYSIAAPGATVIALGPQATLDPAVAGWDRRFPEMRRRSFTDRYGYAPDMIEGAGPVYIAFDPTEILDAMHAALFTKSFVTKLPCPDLGAEIVGAFAGMDILRPLLAAACEGRFGAPLFWRLYRTRRRYPPYLRGLLARLDREGRTLLAALLCRYARDELGLPRFANRLAQLERELAHQGRRLPPKRAPREG